MRISLFFRSHSARPLLALSFLLGFAPAVFSAGAETRSSRTPRRSQPAAIRWSAEQKDALQGIRTLAAEARFRLPAQRYEQEVRRTESTLIRARELSEKPAGDRAAYDDVIRRLQHHRTTLMELQREMTAIAESRPSLPERRQLVATQFENANQKATQYINMLASVLKTMHEMQSGVIRNLR